MQIDRKMVGGDLLEELTLPELVDLWAEEEIYRQLREVELFSSTIVREAQRLGTLLVLPERGGFCEERGAIEVLVEVRDQLERRTRIGAWREKKFGSDDRRAFDRAYKKATAHAIIQLLPAAVWRPWIQATLQ
ncbi:MAG: hypothetical protein ACE5HV_05815 [Acidobacteriota bacterium]